MEPDGEVREFEYVLGLLDGHIKAFSARRDTARWWATRTKLFSVSLAALTTIAIGLGKNNDLFAAGSSMSAWLSAGALVFSALVTASAALESFFDYRWSWVQFTATLGRLHGVKDDLKFAEAKGIVNGQTSDDIYKRLQAILSDTSSVWKDKWTKSDGQEAGK